PLNVDWEPGTTFSGLVDEVSAFRGRAARWQECFAWDAAGNDDATSGAGYFPMAFEVVRLPGPWRVGETTFTVTGAGACVDRFHVRPAGVAAGDAWQLRAAWAAARYSRAAAARIADGSPARLTPVR